MRGKWVVGNQFLEQAGKRQLDKSTLALVIRTMIGFDQSEDCYEYYDFVPSVENQYRSGPWNAPTKTMTSKVSQEDGNKTTILDDFSTPGIEQWMIKTRNAQSETVLTIEGNNRRLDEKNAQ